MAQTSVQVTDRLRIASLFVIHHPSFHVGYGQGVAYTLSERRKDTSHPLSDLFLPDRLTNLIVYHQAAFGAEHDQYFCSQVGYWLGRIHGGVLLPDGSLYPGVSSLVTPQDRYCIRGYDAGRHYHFAEAETDEERTMTDTHVLEQCRELATEYGTYQDSQGTLRYAIGGVLGRLSGMLFPWTAQEHAHMERESMRILGYVESLRPGCLAYQVSLQRA